MDWVLILVAVINLCGDLVVLYMWCRLGGVEDGCDWRRRRDRDLGLARATGRGERGRWPVEDIDGTCELACLLQKYLHLQNSPQPQSYACLYNHPYKKKTQVSMLIDEIEYGEIDTGSENIYFA